MSDERTQKESLVYFLQDHILESMEDMKNIRKTIEDTAIKVDTNLQHTSQIVVENLALSSSSVSKSAKSLQDLAIHVEADLKELSDKLHKRMEDAAEENLRSANLVLKMGAYDLAKEAVLKSTNDIIIPVLNGHIKGTLTAVEGAESSVRALNSAVERAKPYFSMVRWPLYAGLAAAISLSVFFSFYVARAVDIHWPRDFTPQETYLYNRGVFLESLWPTLDEQTKKIYTERVEQMRKNRDQ